MPPVLRLAACRLCPGRPARSGLAKEGGVQLPAGWYTFRVENFSEGESIGFSRAGAYATVTEVSAAAEGPTLVLSGGVEVSPTEIRALRA